MFDSYITVLSFVIHSVWADNCDISMCSASVMLMIVIVALLCIV